MLHTFFLTQKIYANYYYYCIIVLSRILACLSGLHDCGLVNVISVVRL